MTLLTRVGLIGATHAVYTPPVVDGETVTFTGSNGDPWPAPFTDLGTSGGTSGDAYVIGIHGYQGGPSPTSFGSSRNYPVSTTGDVPFVTITSQGQYDLGSGQYAWGDYSDYPTGPFWDWDTELEPIFESLLAQCEGNGPIWLHGFSEGAAVCAEALRNSWDADGRLAGVVFDDPADPLGTLSNPNSIPVVLYATTPDGGSTWNQNTNNAATEPGGILEKYEAAFVVSRIRSDTTSPAGPTSHAPHTRSGSSGSSGPYAPGELLDAASWPLSEGGSTATIQDNQGQLQTGALGGYNDNIFRGFTPTSQNYEVAVDIIPTSYGNEGYARLAWRQQDTRAEYAVSVSLGSGNVSVFEQDSSFAATVRAQQTAAVTSASDVVHVKVRVDGTAHKAKWWLNAASEPSGWQAEFTDATLTNGYLCLYLVGGTAAASRTARFDNFLVTYLDAEPPPPPGSNTLPAALSSTHGNERTLVFSSRRNIWGTDGFSGEMQKYIDAGITFGDGGTSMVMTADDGAPTSTGYSSGATNNYDTNIDPVTPGSYIQARLKCPVGKGFWPAFWMMPSAGGAAFEVDVLEQLGLADRFDMNHHVGWNGSSYNQSYGTTVSQDVTEFFNVGVHLASDATRYYVNGSLVWTVPSVVNVSMAVALNFALGGPGSYPGPIDGTTPFPSTFEVQSVKVWTATSSGGGSGGTRGVVSLAGAGGGKGAYNMGSGCDHARGDFETRDTWGNGSGGTTWDATNWASGKAIIEEAATGLGQFIIHGFSIGGMFAQEVLHRGETFGGRLKGIVLDDPAHNWGTDGDPSDADGFVNPAGLPVALYGCRNAGNTAWTIDEFYSDFGYMQRIADAYGVTLVNSASVGAAGTHRPVTRRNDGNGPYAPPEIANGSWWT